MLFFLQKNEEVNDLKQPNESFPAFFSKLALDPAKLHKLQRKYFVLNFPSENAYKPIKEKRTPARIEPV